MSKILIIFAVLLLMVSSCLAIDIGVDTGVSVSVSGDFSVEVVPVENKIAQGGTATIQLNVKNNKDSAVKYRLDFENTGDWVSVGTEPVYHGLSGMDVNALSSEITSVIINSKEGISFGTYFIKTTVMSEATNEKVVILLPVSIKTSDELAGIRLPDLRVSLDVPKKVDPREENTITVYLLNKNNRDISNLSIVVKSKLIGERELISSLSPNEDKELKIKFVLDPLTSPQEDTVSGSVVVGGYTFTPTSKTFEVVTYNPSLVVDEKSSTNFFKTVKTISVVNTGNSVVSDTIKVRRGVFESFFTSSNEKPRIVELDDVKYYSWPVNINPDSSARIVITTNYQLLFWLILLIVAGLVLKYVTQNKIKIVKKCTSSETSEGGLSNMTVLLAIRNDSGKAIHDIDIKDVIPHIAEIKKEFAVGTVKPDQILNHKTKGTIVKWKIDELDSSEERLIKYEIKSRLHILGTFTLPAARVTFRTLSGSEKFSISNKLVIGNE